MGVGSVGSVRELTERKVSPGAFARLNDAGSEPRTRERERKREKEGVNRTVGEEWADREVGRCCRRWHCRVARKGRKSFAATFVMHAG